LCHKRPYSETSDYQRVTAPAQKIQPRWQHFDPVGKLLMHDGSSRAQSTTASIDLFARFPVAA
jgi:hypothetical protein